jgi:hypothetical protein
LTPKDLNAIFSSLHATEAAIGVWLLLFWPVVVTFLTICSSNPWLSDIACYSITFQLSFLLPCGGIPGRSVFQAYDVSIPKDLNAIFSSLRGRSPLFTEAL